MSERERGLTHPTSSISCLLMHPTPFSQYISNFVPVDFAHIFPSMHTCVHGHECLREMLSSSVRAKLLPCMVYYSDQGSGVYLHMHERLDELPSFSVGDI